MPLPCVCQKHAEPAFVLAEVSDLRDRPVHSQVLMVLGGDLDQPAPNLLVDDEVLDDVEEPSRFADAPDRRLQRYHALLAFVVDALPLEEVFPRREGTADTGRAAVRQHHQRVLHEQLRDGVAVVVEVAVVSVLEVLMDRLQFHQ